MKKLIGLVFLMTILQQVIGQTETFDIIHYTPPKDPAGIVWKKDMNQGVVNYTNVNESTGHFCIITIYASTVSTNDPDKDFRNDWKELVVTPYKAGDNPETETQTIEDGWKVVTSVAAVKVDGTDVYILLTVVSGFGKTVSIRCSMNHQSYVTDIDALFATMEFDKTKTATVNNNKAVTAPTTGATEKFGTMMYTAPAEWSEEIFSDGVVFKPSDIPAGEHRAIQIMQPLNASGTLE